MAASIAGFRDRVQDKEGLRDWVSQLGLKKGSVRSQVVRSIAEPLFFFLVQRVGWGGGLIKPELRSKGLGV